jgi:hypothetical protein
MHIPSGWSSENWWSSHNLLKFSSLLAWNSQIETAIKLYYLLQTGFKDNVFVSSHDSNIKRYWTVSKYHHSEF